MGETQLVASLAEEDGDEAEEFFCASARAAVRLRVRIFGEQPKKESRSAPDESAEGS